MFTEFVNPPTCPLTESSLKKCQNPLKTKIRSHSTTVLNGNRICVANLISPSLKLRFPQLLVITNALQQLANQLSIATRSRALTITVGVTTGTSVNEEATLILESSVNVTKTM